MKKHKWSVIMCLSLCLMLVSLAVMLTSMKPSESTFVAPEQEPNATKGVPDTDDPDYASIEDEGLPFKTAICGMPKRSDDGLTVYFTNPETNEGPLMLQVLDENGLILAQTGLVDPGYYLKEIDVDLDSGKEITMKVNGYSKTGYYSIGSFELQTQVG